MVNIKTYIIIVEVKLPSLMGDHSIDWHNSKLPQFMPCYESKCQHLKIPQRQTLVLHQGVWTHQEHSSLFCVVFSSILVTQVLGFLDFISAGTCTWRWCWWPGKVVVPLPFSPFLEPTEPVLGWSTLMCSWVERGALPAGRRQEHCPFLFLLSAKAERS